MEASVRKKLGDALLRDLSSKENKKTRKQISGATPQLLFLENLDFINDTIKELVSRDRIPKSVKTVEFTKTDLETARTIANKYQKSYIKRHSKFKTGASDIENTMGGRHLKNKFPQEFAKVLRGEAFMMSSFDQIRLCKVEIIRKFVKASEKSLGKITRAVDRGHGGGDGVAVSGVQAAKGFGRADKALETKEQKKQFQEEFQAFMKEAFDEAEIELDVYNDLIRIQLKYEQIVTSTGKLSATYIPFLTFQDKYTNQVTDRAREVQVKNLIEKFFKKVGAGELASMEGSSSLEEKVYALALSKFSNIKGAKLNVDPRIDPKKTPLKTKGSPTSKIGKGGKSSGLKKRPKKPLPPGRTSRAKQSSVSMGNILGILNQRLPDTVVKNMGSPRLENRTGRFAGSVRVVDMTQTRQGFPSIGYTYRRDPYEVYEASSGTRFSSRARDPRPLIDASIRELAVQLGLAKLYTRRV